MILYHLKNCHFFIRCYFLQITYALYCSSNLHSCNINSGRKKEERNQKVKPAKHRQNTRIQSLCIHIFHLKVFRTRSFVLHHALGQIRQEKVSPLIFWPYNTILILNSMFQLKKTRKPAWRVFLAPPEGLMIFLSSLYHA